MTRCGQGLNDGGEPASDLASRAGPVAPLIRAPRQVWASMVVGCADHPGPRPTRHLTAGGLQPPETGQSLPQDSKSV